MSMSCPRQPSVTISHQQADVGGMCQPEKGGGRDGGWRE